jgi:hypothetical protein
MAMTGQTLVNIGENRGFDLASGLGIHRLVFKEAGEAGRILRALLSLRLLFSSAVAFERRDKRANKNDKTVNLS